MSDDELAAVKRHNAWVEELQHDIEWAPLREFVGLLREPEPALTPPAIATTGQRAGVVGDARYHETTGN